MKKIILEYDILFAILDKIDEPLSKLEIDKIPTSPIMKYRLYVFCNSNEEAKDMKEYIDKNVKGATCKEIVSGSIGGTLKTQIGDDNGCLLCNGCSSQAECRIEVWDKTENLVNSFDKWYREKFKEVVKMLLDDK